MTSVATIGLDIAKSVFQVHGVDAAGQVVVRQRLARRRVLAFFRKAGALSRRDRGLQQLALLGARTHGARARGPLDAGAICQALC